MIKNMCVGGIPKKNVAALILLFVGNLTFYMDRYILFGLMSQVQSYYKLSDSQAGFLQTVFLIFFMIFSLIFGALGDMMQRKWLIIIGMSISSASTLLGSFIPPEYYICFYATRCLVGAGQSSLGVLGFVVINNLFPTQHRSLCLSLYFSASPLGGGLGYLLSSQIMKHTPIWQWALRLTPIPTILVLVLLLLCLDETPHAEVLPPTPENTLFTQPIPNMMQSSPLTSSYLSQERLDSSSSMDDTQGECNICNPNESVLMVTACNSFIYFWQRKSFIYCTLGYTGVTFVFGALAVWAPKYFQLVNYHIPSIMPRNMSNPANVGIYFGGLICITGLVGVVLGSRISVFLKRYTNYNDLYLCIFCCVSGSITLFFSIFSSFYYFLITWVATSATLASLALMWTSNCELILNIIHISHHSRAGAIQGFVTHALGDAISPTIIGFISDHVKKSNSPYHDMQSLYIALYITPFILCISTLLYVFCMYYYEHDHEDAKDQNTQFLTHSIPDIMIETT